MPKIVSYFLNFIHFLDEGDFDDEKAAAEIISKEMGVGDSPKGTPEKKTKAETDKPAPQPEVKKEEVKKVEEKTPEESEPKPKVLDLDNEEGKESGASKSEIIDKMKQQNAKLKKEFAALKDKLEECIEKAKKTSKPAEKQANMPTEEDVCIFLYFSTNVAREQEIKGIENKIAFYKKQIQTMKRQLEGSFNIDKYNFIGK